MAKCLIISWERGQDQDLGEKKGNRDESKSLRLRLKFMTEFGNGSWLERGVTLPLR